MSEDRRMDGAGQAGPGRVPEMPTREQADALAASNRVDVVGASEVAVDAKLGQYTAEGFAAVLAAYGVEVVPDSRHYSPYARAWAGTPAASDGWPLVWSKLDDMAEDRLRVRIADVVRTTRRSTPARYSKEKWVLHLNAHMDTRRRDTFVVHLADQPRHDGEERLSLLLWDAFGAEGRLAEWASRYMFCGPVYRARVPGAKLDETPMGSQPALAL